MAIITAALGIIIAKVTSSLIDYKLDSGWSKVFNGNINVYKKSLEDILIKTITEFEKANQTKLEDGKFPFYHSQIFLDSILKLQLFKNQPQENIQREVKKELNTNHNIQKASEKELELFFEIFFKNLNSDEKFKNIEIDTNYKKVIFETYSELTKLRQDFNSINFDETVLLRKEYEAQVDEIFEEIKRLRFLTALNKVNGLEKRIKSNLQSSSQILLSKIEFLKAVCHDSTDNADLARKCYIKAYLLNPHDLKIIEKACWIYLKQEAPSYEALLKQLENTCPLNPYLWAIKTATDNKIIEFIKQAPQFIQDDFQYKKLVFNYFISNNPSILLEIDFLFDNIKYDIPQEVTYENFSDLIFLANLNFSIYIQKIRIEFAKQLEKTDESEHLYSILDKLNAVRLDSELGSSYNQLSLAYTWLKSEIYFDEVKAEDLTAAIANVESPERTMAVFVANSLQKRGDLDSALKILDREDNDELALTLKLFCQRNPESASSVAEDYLNSIHTIDEKNIANICFFLERIVKDKLVSPEELRSILDSKEYNSEHFRDLLVLLTDTHLKSTTINIKEILALKDALAQNKFLNIFIAILFYDNKYYHECIKFIQPQIKDKTAPDQGLLHIIIDSIINLGTAHQEKLLSLLKLWRENFETNPYYISKEIELYTYLKDWNSVKSISEYALCRIGENEFFFVSYIDSLIQAKDYTDLEKTITKIQEYPYEHVENALYLSTLLIKSNYVEDGFNLLYKYAKDKSNLTARWEFFKLSIDHQDNSVFKDFDTVKPDSYVKFSVDGVMQTKYVPKEESTDILIQSLLNKKKGDSFSITKGLSNSLVKVTIERIVSNFNNLIIEIHEEFNNPIPDYPVEIINTIGGDIDSLRKNLIENFGIKNDVNEIKLKENISNYYQYKNPFFLITLTNFKKNFILAYYALTSKGSEGYMVNPKKLNIESLNVSNTKFVLDFTSGLLLYELSKSNKEIEFPCDFVIGQSLITHIESLIYQLKTDTSELSVTIRGNSIIPFYKTDDAKENQINFLLEVKKWFETVCKIEIPQEKLNFSPQFTKDGIDHEDMDLLLETSLLAHRNNHLLISDDLVYSTDLKLTNRQVSSDHFLVTLYPEKRKQIFNHLILKRYIGINFNSDDLYDCYVEKNHIEKSHVYEFCLRNLELFYSLIPKRCNTLILDFLKRLSLNAVYNEQTVESEALNIFTRCFKTNISREIVTDLGQKADHSFNLLPTYFDVIERAVEDSIGIINNNN